MKILIVGGLTPRSASLFHSTGETVEEHRAAVDELNVLSIGDRLSLEPDGRLLALPSMERALGVMSNPRFVGTHSVKLWGKMLDLIETLKTETPKGTR